MPRLRIFALLGKEAYLKPISGDRINEMNMLQAMARHHDVYYNGVPIVDRMDAFGRIDGRIEVPKRGDFDLIYVRNNKPFFLASPSPKLWFASPYDQECFDQADGIVAMTKTWATRLRHYTADDYEFFDCMYPLELKAPKKVLCFPQAVNAISWEELEKKRRERPTGNSHTWRDVWGLWGKAPRREKVIRHFGPIRVSNFPIHLAYYLDKSPELSRKFVAECVGAGERVALPPSIRSAPQVPAPKVQELLLSSHAIWYSQHESGNFAGSLKVLEAMANGVPLLLPRWDARVDELGADYPFFWSVAEGKSYSDPEQPDFLRKLKQLVDLADDRRLEIGRHLHSRAERHSVANVGTIINTELVRFYEEK